MSSSSLDFHFLWTSASPFPDWSHSTALLHAPAVVTALTNRCRAVDSCEEHTIVIHHILHWSTSLPTCSVQFHEMGTSSILIWQTEVHEVMSLHVSSLRSHAWLWGDFSWSGVFSYMQAWPDHTFLSQFPFCGGDKTHEQKQLQGKTVCFSPGFRVHAIMVGKSRAQKQKATGEMAQVDVWRSWSHDISRLNRGGGANAGSCLAPFLHLRSAKSQLGNGATLSG